MPVIKFVVVGLAPLRGGSLVPLRGVVDIFLRAAPSLLYKSTPPPPPPGVEVYRLIKLLGSLSSSVSERRTSTGSGLFASLGSGLVETLG